MLVFLASMVLLVKRMPEQDGAPGNLFKGPLFAFVLVMIGLMSLLVTACTLIIEYCDVESAKEVVEKISAKLSKRSDEERWREREARGDEDSVDAVEIKIDGAPAAGGWLSSIAGAKRPAARDARGAPEAKTGEAPADEEAKTRAKNRGLSRLISKSAEKTNAKLSRPPPPRRQRSRAGRRRRRRG